MLHGTAMATMAALTILLAGSGAASAQVAAGGLGTRVNGTALGRCSAGVCSVQGGSAAGPNIFHRFSQFDTRAGIQRVELDSRGRSNVVVGVSHPAGSFFGAPLRLSGAANLFWLSPGGIWLGNGASFQGATSLLLSTAPTMRLGGGTFNALGGLADRLGAWADAPSLDLAAARNSKGLDPGQFEARTELTAVSKRWGELAAAQKELTASAFLLVLDDGRFAQLQPDLPLPAASSIKTSGRPRQRHISLERAPAPYQRSGGWRSRLDGQQTGGHALPVF